ncbi:hypothetical protein L198_02485 [Cryptococcus wingfieldii CBS 7118]|uniref:Uncharacterized protein n=1 Tax=Cryptococcus wingfieldii CBS 7118 TaxID=1295528 RepID=A0A1E3JS04_9TREE|nr:hypothetical protein L198_02485 [Cryptococcus wingfieldii CBS 7118]ODO03634.1 hypothetical protein L198_02485 [Cryptococcus wingfieldii CBS 7118]
MSSITPSNFAPLLPVHNLIFTELLASAPSSVIALCSSAYERAAPVLYTDIHSSPGVFRGLQEEKAYGRTIEALRHTKTLSVGGSESFETLYELAGPEPRGHCCPMCAPFRIVPTNPSNMSSPYSRVYNNLFPNLERLELGFGSLKASAYHYDCFDSVPSEEDPLFAGGSRDSIVRQVARLMPYNLKEIVFHLDEDEADYWYEVDSHLCNQRPREAIIFLKGTVKGQERDDNRPLCPESEAKRTTFGRLGERLPLEWDNGVRLRVFVETREPWESLNARELRGYIISMGMALVRYVLLDSHQRGRWYWDGSGVQVGHPVGSYDLDWSSDSDSDTESDDSDDSDVAGDSDDFEEPAHLSHSSHSEDSEDSEDSDGSDGSDESSDSGNSDDSEDEKGQVGLHFAQAIQSQDVQEHGDANAGGANDRAGNDHGRENGAGDERDGAVNEVDEEEQVFQIEIFLPLLHQVLAQMPANHRILVDAMVGEGRLVLREYDVKEVEKLGDLRLRW